MPRSALLCVLLFASSAAAAPPAKPNLVVILADDLGYECISANGGESYSTPNIDRLANLGARFERGYSQPLCTPTRLQLMTGQYNVRNYTHFGELRRTETTFAQLLKQAGYSTGIFGKWQLGREIDSPQHFGFDTSVLWQHTRRPSRYPNPGLEFNGAERNYTMGEFGPDVVQTEVLKFIDANSSKPFLLYYPMMLVHGPFIPTPEDAEYDRKATNENAGQDKKFFASMMKVMDRHVGELLARLEQNGVKDRTVVIFVGDNGTGKGITSRFQGHDYAGGKGQSTTTGMHVPYIVHWPGVTQSGSVVRQLADTTDVLPTLLDAAGVARPQNLQLDGSSLRPALLGQSGTRETIYSWHPTPKREFAASPTHKLYADGTLVTWGRVRMRNRPSRQLPRRSRCDGACRPCSTATPKPARPN